MNNFERLICTLFNNNIRFTDDSELTVEYVKIDWQTDEILVKYNKIEEEVGLPLYFLNFVCDRGMNVDIVNREYTEMLARNLGIDLEPKKFVPECSTVERKVWHVDCGDMSPQESENLLKKAVEKVKNECSNCGYDTSKTFVDNSPIKGTANTVVTNANDYDKNYNFFKQKKSEEATVKTNNSAFVKEEASKLDLEDDPPYVDDDFTLLLALNGQIFII